ncbi:MAG: hypothetical protein FJX77_04325, partial [Armatimonadetes bacterium]|nr:hypothetical protein [Armatimonadota bacterium]
PEMTGDFLQNGTDQPTGAGQVQHPTVHQVFRAVRMRSVWEGLRIMGDTSWVGVSRLTRLAARLRQVRGNQGWLGSPYLWWILVALAIWPSYQYLNRRMVPFNTEDPGGILMLVVTGLLWRESFRHRGVAREGQGVPLAVVGLLGLTALSYPWIPPLGSALFGLGSLGLVCYSLPGVRWRERSGWWFAFLAGAPPTETFSFFFGGILRALTTPLTALLLRLVGVPATTDGATLEIGGQMVTVDAPCSGVNGLWTAGVVAALVAAHRQWSPVQTCWLLATGLCLSLPANAFRSAGLTLWTVWAFRPTGISEDTVHTLAGLSVFVGWLVVLLYVPPLAVSGLLRVRGWKGSRVAPGWLVATVVAAAVAPLRPERSPTRPAGAPRWPSTWLGAPLTPLPPTAMDRRWAPGDPIARYLLPEGGEILFRWVARPGTRSLHPPEDCYRANGYSVGPLRLVRAPTPDPSVFLGAPEGTAPGQAVWRRFEVGKRDRRWEVRSLLLSVRGPTYSDPSWWWWKVCGVGATDRGPWISVTVEHGR